MFPFNMPGSFFGQSETPLSPLRPNIPSIPSTEVQEAAKQAVESVEFSQFSNKQKVTKKTQRQANLLRQLDTLVYMLVGYQLIKYCHSASLVPVLCHLSIQKLMSSECILDKEAATFMEFVKRLREAQVENGVDDASRERILGSVVSRVCSLVYWKSILIILYHIGFICFWLIPIANHNNGSLSNISNGTWWFVSFIGEDRPIDDWMQLNYFNKMIHLGLVGVIVSDILILFIQLCIFQAVFKQSTMSPVGNTEGVELEVVRRVGDGFTLTNDDGSFIEMDADIPVALRLRLYDTFTWTSFNPRRA